MITMLDSRIIYHEDNKCRIEYQTDSYNEIIKLIEFIFKSDKLIISLERKDITLEINLSRTYNRISIINVNKDIIFRLEKFVKNYNEGKII